MWAGLILSWRLLIQLVYKSRIHIHTSLHEAGYAIYRYSQKPEINESVPCTFMKTVFSYRWARLFTEVSWLITEIRGALFRMTR